MFACALIALVALVFYLPSAHAPDRFLAQLRIERELNDRIWGAQRSLRILERALTLYGKAQDASPIPPAFAEAVAPVAIDLTVARQISDASARLFGSRYFMSFQALLALASYRLASLLEWLSLVAVFVLVAIFDGFVRRAVKSKEFLQHSPELFALYAGLSMVAIVGTPVALLVPVTLHPYALAVVPLLIGVLGNRAIANFHARG
jgi:hypothetical protein